MPAVIRSKEAGNEQFKVQGGGVFKHCKYHRQAYTLTVGHTQAILELRFDPDLLEPVVDLRASAMDQDTSDANSGEKHNVRDDSGLRAHKYRIC